MRCPRTNLYGVAVLRTPHDPPPPKSRIALQVARKFAPCDRALIHVCLAYLFLHSGQEWFFIGTVLATGPECIINIYMILGRRNLFEMGAVRSARDQWRRQSDIWSCKCKFFCVKRPYKKPISKEMNNDNN